MPDLDDIVDVDGPSFGRMLMLLVRGLWWLVWDLGCEWIAWSIGWPVCRLLSAGRLPSVGFTEVEEGEWWEQLRVMVVGFAMIAALAWAASRMLHA